MTCVCTKFKQFDANAPLRRIRETAVGFSKVCFLSEETELMDKHEEMWVRRF